MKNPADYILDLYRRIEESGLTNWPLLAAALSYYTALSVTPVLAICFAVARSMGLEDALRRTLSENFVGQDAILATLTEFAENLIRNFSGSLLVFTALAVIFWSVHGILWQLEVNFSKIFGYLSNRTAVRRAADYLTIMLFIPIFLIAAGAINIFLAGFDGSGLPVIGRLQLGPLHTTLMVVFPVLVWWVILAWTYAYFSRGVIRWRERLIGGFITGLVFQVFQKFYLGVMISITSYNAVYGSFAIVPLFMVWIYVSWLIVIFGGEFTRRLADRFLSGLRFTAILVPVSWSELKELSADIMDKVVEDYESERPNPTGFLTLAVKLKRPLPQLGRAVNILQSAGLITRVAAPESDEAGPCFLPAVAPDHLTRTRVFEALEALVQPVT